MVFMDRKDSKDGVVVVDIDLEVGAHSPLRVSAGEEEKMAPLEMGVGSDKKKKGSGKKPPRPPRAPSLDAADKKLIREIAELAMLKRARVERMRALKKMKNAKVAPSAATGSVFASVVTIMFCIVILWQGIFSGRSSSVIFQDSHASPSRARDGLISVQLYRNLPAGRRHGSTSVSPNNAERVTGLEDPTPRQTGLQVD